MKQRRIKILQLQPECHDRSHDPSDLAEQIVAAFPQDRFEFTSAFLQGKPLPSQPPSCAEKTHYFDLPESAFKGLRLRLKWDLYRFCRKHNFDVVICNRYKPVSAIQFLNRWLNIPVCVGISHGLGEYKTAWRRYFARRNIDNKWHFVGVSQAVTEYLMAQECGFTRNNTTTINNAIDISQTETALYTRDEARSQLQLPNNLVVIGAIGRLAKVKGHIHLVRGFAHVASEFQDAALAIIGDGKEEASLRRAAEELGIASRVHLLGWRDKAGKYAGAFDILVMPSLSEGLPRALLEGMCARLPIIASDIPALRPIVESAGGQLFPPGNERALADELRHILRLTAEERRKKGEQTYLYLVTNHTIEAYQAAYKKLIEDLLERNSHGF
jgi:glycosyltransferase involved in cell wall biosynthesis